jgi:mono/diheme cytochrome c family protein
MRRLTGLVVTLIVALLVASAVAVALAFAGLVPVAATAHHSSLLEWYFEEALDHAVDRGAESIQPPPLDDPALLRAGIVHYQEMCLTCHGAPGIEPSEIGKGLYPKPPLLERRKRMRPAPTYWLVKNGIRDTGMPAFGATHSERELWAVVAFTVAMPHMAPEEYARRAREAGLQGPLGEGMEEAAGAAAPAPAGAPGHGHAQPPDARPVPSHGPD